MDAPSFFGLSLAEAVLNRVIMTARFILVGMRMGKVA